MRLAYGAMGHGRGHAMRSSAMIDRLGSKHTVPVYAGPDACRVMKGRYDCELIPSIRYHDGASGSIDAALTIKRNPRPGLDLLFAGPHARRLSASWDRFEPELVISDSETWSPQLARALGIPRISLDHGGIMAYCRPRFPGTDQLLAQRDRFADLSMMGCPKQSMVSGFIRPSHGTGMCACSDPSCVPWRMARARSAVSTCSPTSTRAPTSIMTAWQRHCGPVAGR